MSASQETQTQTTTQTQTQAQVLPKGRSKPLPYIQLNLGSEGEGLFQAKTYAPHDIGQMIPAANYQALPETWSGRTRIQTLQLNPSVTPFLSLKDGLKRVRLSEADTPSDASAKAKLREFANHLHPNLRATLNFLPCFEWDFKDSNVASYTPYDVTQHNFGASLLVKEKSGKIRMILLSLSDEKIFKNLLAKASSQKNIPNQEVSLALMNKHGDVFAASPDLIEPQKLAEDPQVLLMRVQAKFMNGDLTYSPQELSALKAWMGDRTQTYFKEMFEQQFLPRQDRNLAEYLNSPIYRALHAEQRLPLKNSLEKSPSS